MRGRRRAFKYRKGLAAAVAALLLACGSDRLASSEIGNPPKRGTVMGVIYAEGGKPAPGTRIGLLPTHYDPVRDTAAKIWFDTTDAKGAFSIDSVDSGSYNIQALQLSVRTRLLIQGVEVRSDTTVASSHQYLQEPGVISILIPDSVPTKNAYVYLPGSQVHASTASLVGESRLIYLDSVPCGASPEILFRSSSPDSSGQTKRIRLSDGVTVVSGDTIPASAFQEWAHSSRIFLNTTAGGANIVAAPVLNFPMALRLGPGASLFSEAAADGRDVRFSKPDGQPLNYEIESWDRSASQAVIWIKLDTVRANDSDQFIRMYWGNPSATSAAKPVFETDAGFQSVWHMESMQAGTPPKLRDATSIGNTLSAGALSASDLVPSPLGTGINLSGDSTMLFTGKQFDSPQVFTISLWLKTTTSGGGKLIGFGEDPLMIDTGRDRHLWMDTLGLVHFGVNSKAGTKQGFNILSSSQALNDGKWHLVAGVLWSGGQVLYVDGNKAGEDPAVTVAQGYAKGYWKLGFDFKFWDWPFAPRDLYFKGAIDEARVSTKPFSKEWFKLSYESQRADSRFLRFDKR